MATSKEANSTFIQVNIMVRAINQPVAVQLEVNVEFAVPRKFASKALFLLQPHVTLRDPTCSYNRHL